MHDVLLSSMPDIAKARGRRRRAVMTDAASDFDFTLRGLKRHPLQDVFHTLLNLRWSILIAVTGLAYALMALLFAVAYALDPDPNGIDGAREGYFSDIFFYSIRTLSTTDTHMTPSSVYSNIVCSIEGFVGLVFQSFVTGSLFAKLSRPIARISFSDRCLLQQVDGKPCLIFRMVNQRRTPVISVTIRAAVLLKKVSSEGLPSFVYKQLDLDTTSIPLFVGGLQFKHVIDKNSPLFGFEGPSDARKCGLVSIQTLIAGTEEVYGNLIHARKIFEPADVLAGHRFARMLDTDLHGRLTVDVRRLNDVEEIPDGGVLCEASIGCGHLITRSRRSSERIAKTSSEHSKGTSPATMRAPRRPSGEVGAAPAIDAPHGKFAPAPPERASEPEAPARHSRSRRASSSAYLANLPPPIDVHSPPTNASHGRARAPADDPALEA